MSSNNEVEVTVVFTVTSRSERLLVPKEQTLQNVLEYAYSKFGETKQTGDKYFCKTGTPLSDELSKKIEDVVNSTCKVGVIEIRRPTGGAQIAKFEAIK